MTLCAAGYVVHFTCDYINYSYQKHETSIRKTLYLDSYTAYMTQYLIELLRQSPPPATEPK